MDRPEEMDVTSDTHAGDSSNGAPVVNLINCTEDQISSDNLIQLTHLSGTELTDSGTLGRYINLRGAENLFHSNNGEANQIQFLVIHGQSDTLSTQSKGAQTKPTEEVTSDHWISKLYENTDNLVGELDGKSHYFTGELDDNTNHLSGEPDGNTKNLGGELDGKSNQLSGELDGKTQHLSDEMNDNIHHFTGELSSSNGVKSEQCVDRMICGQCQKVCWSVLEFLEHKGMHIGRGLGLGCEVCDLTFSRTKSLQDHYRRKHKIKFANKVNKGREAKTDIKERKKNAKKHRSGLIALREEQRPGANVNTENEEMITLDQAVNENFIRDETSKGIVDLDSVESNPYITTEVKGQETQHEEQLSTYPKGNIDDWVSSSDLSRTDQDSETAVLQAVSKATDIRHGQVNVSSVPNLDCVAIRPDSMQGNIDQMDGNVSSVLGGGILMADNDKMQELSKTVPALETGNIHVVSENTQDESGDMRCSNRIANSKKDSSVLPVNHNTEHVDLSRELEMPDFYFIAVIERGPRNSIKGCKYHFKCLYCDLKLSWRNLMCQHMKEKHKDILELGPVLNIAQQNLESKHKVVKMSEYVKLEKTRKKGKRFRGIETQDLPGDFPCGKCGKMFHRLRNLRKHEVLHKKEKNLLCSICVKSFKTLPNLNQHMKTHKEREAYKCRQCDFESTINIVIHAHRQLHKDGCVLCDICGCAYNDKSTLAKHKKVHDLSRPYACTFPGCTWRFKTKSMCSAHFKAHTTKPKFECKICQYAFRQKHHLQRHESKIHNMTSENKCMYTVLPVSFVDEGVIVTDETKLLDIDSKPLQHEVSLIINEDNEENVEEQFDLESALQNGQLVIATDSDGNMINYEIADMGLNVAYQTLLPDTDRQHMDSQTILLPQTDGGEILYQHEEVTETICTEVNTSMDTAS